MGTNLRRFLLYTKHSSISSELIKYILKSKIIIVFYVKISHKFCKYSNYKHRYLLVFFLTILLN